MKTYRADFDASTQITAEERIAAAIFDKQYEDATFSEQDCADLGRAILKQVLEEFRPDLFTETDDTTTEGLTRSHCGDCAALATKREADCNCRCEGKDQR